MLQTVKNELYLTIDCLSRSQCEALLSCALGNKYTLRPTRKHNERFLESIKIGKYILLFIVIKINKSNINIKKYLYPQKY